MRPATARLLAAGLALAGALGAGAWWAGESDGIAWLSPEGAARWIVYPTPSDAVAHPLVELGATFRRDFAVGAVPRSVTLRLRAFRGAAVRVNGAPVRLDGEGPWKRIRTAELAALLRPGSNRIEVLVSNASGPPALWADLEGAGVGVATDASWAVSLAGATWQPAAVATEGARGRRVDPDGWVPSPLEAARRRWPTLLGLLVGSAALSLVVVRVAARGDHAPGAGAASPLVARLALAVAIAAWAAIFLHDLAAIPLQLGFDAPQHLEYVQYVLGRRALPLADEGWQMFQPPLYYVAAALSLAAAGLDTASPGAVVVFRAIGLATGVLHLVLVAALLRRAFPGSALRQAAGIAVAAALPCLLVLHQFPTNELVVAMLSSATLLAAWRILDAPRPSVGRAAAAGGLLGLALLAKLSALLLVPVLAAVLVARTLAWPRALGWRRGAELGVACAAALAACGWHYARVWAHFGTPFVGGWDAGRGIGWWLDPGFRTPAHFLRFGRALVAPVFAGFDGFWDGLYSTLWGDGMLSGLASTAPLRPWWSQTLHPAGYLLALLPAAAVVAGFAATVWEWIRRPAARSGSLVLLATLVLAALAAMSLRVPAVAEDKASYGLLALAPLCAFAARGLGLLAGRSRWRAVAVGAALGTWAAVSGASLWVDRDGAEAAVRRATVLSAGGATGARAAVDVLRDAVGRHPDAWDARVALARLLMETRGPSDEVAGLLRVREPEPARADRLLAIAELADRRGDVSAAALAAARAAELDPDDPDAHALHARLLEVEGDAGAAARAWREVLRVRPHDGSAHAALARLYARAGDGDAAALHAADAARLLR